MIAYYALLSSCVICVWTPLWHFSGSSSCLTCSILALPHNAPMSGRASKSRYVVHFTWFAKGSGGIFLVQCRDLILFIGRNDWITDLTSNYQDTTIWQICFKWIPLFNALYASHYQQLISFPNPNAFTLAFSVNHVMINSVVINGIQNASHEIIATIYTYWNLSHSLWECVFSYISRWRICKGYDTNWTTICNCIVFTFHAKTTHA